MKTMIYDKDSDLSHDPRGEAVKTIVLGCAKVFAQFRDKQVKGTHIGEILVGALISVETNVLMGLAPEKRAEVMFHLDEARKMMRDNMETIEIQLTRKKKVKCNG